MKKLLLFTPILLILLFTACEKDVQNKQPSAPVLISPENGAVINSEAFTFKWEASTDPEGDEIRYSFNLYDDTTLVKLNILAGTEYTFDYLQSGKKYTWKVLSINRADEDDPFVNTEEVATHSETRYFFTSPPNVQNLSDTSGDGFVTLTWNDIENLDHIEITITPEVSSFSQPVTINAGTEKAEFTGLTNRTLYSFVFVTIDKEGNRSHPDTIQSLPLASDEVQDYDFNVYTTVKIGEQVWLRENLRTTRYQDGTAMTKWNENLYIIGSKSDNYGYYYRPDLDKNPCPIGYHIPTDEEWKTLEKFLGMSDEDMELFCWDAACRGVDENCGFALKSKTGWNDFEGSDGNGNDLYGLNILPAGWIDDGQEFEVGEVAMIYTSTLYSESYYHRSFFNNSTGIQRYMAGNFIFASIRCIKD